MRRRAAKTAAIVALVVALAAPAWGAALSQVLQGGDTLSVTCVGQQLDETVVNPTRRDLTCVPSTTSTTSTSTTSTMTAPTTTAPPSGQFVETFANLNNWTFAHSAYEIPPVPDPRSTATVVNGQARIDAFDQNYGDATLRSGIKYDLSAGGVVTLDIADNGGGQPLVGFAYVMFSANPDDAKHTDTYYPANNPADALVVQLRDNCRIPWGPPTVIRFLGGQVGQQGNCSATPDGRLRLVFSPGHLSIRNGANAEIVSYHVTVPPTGWVILGVHNHASQKYGGGSSVVGLFDNVTYPTGASAATTTTSTTVPPTSSSTTTVPPTTPPTTAPSGSGGFTESFATDQRSRFDFQLHTSPNGAVPTRIADTFIGEHNMACGGADTHRTVHGGQGSTTGLDVSNSELSWWCAPSGDPASGHMMTALDTADIATLSFTPKQTFTNVTRVCWDQNMNNLGEAKWVNVFVVPADDVTAHGGNFSYVATSGLPFGGNNRIPPTGSFDFTWLRGSTYANKWVNGNVNETMSFWASYFPHGMVPDGPLDSAPRFTICLNSGGNMVIERPDGTTDTRPIGTTFPTGAVKVIFQDASYNPTKHEGSVDDLTWHWDNIVVSTGGVVPVAFTGPETARYCAV